MTMRHAPPATPARDTPRRAWWAGRIDVEEIIDAGAIAARPEWPAPPIVGGIIGGPAQRRRDRLPAPPRRERPADLEASATGLELYGPHRAVPMPYQLAGPAARTPADTTGDKLTYRPLEGRGARVTGIRVNTLGTIGALEWSVVLRRGGTEYVLWNGLTAQLITSPWLTLQPGDELAVVVTTAGGAGSELVATFSAEEYT